MRFIENLSTVDGLRSDVSVSDILLNGSDWLKKSCESQRYEGK